MEEVEAPCPEDKVEARVATVVRGARVVVQGVTVARVATVGARVVRGAREARAEVREVKA
jgi:hypothetical protein